MRLALELRGVRCLDIEQEVANRKIIIALRSFGRRVTGLTEMCEPVAAYIALTAEKLRRRHLATASLMAFVETNRFRPDETQHHAARTVSLPMATSDTGKLIAAALTGLDAISATAIAIRKPASCS